MLTFTEWLDEALDHPYDYKYAGKGSIGEHQYKFKGKGGHTHTVSIYPDSKGEGHHDVDFDTHKPRGGTYYKKTDHAGHKAVRVFSTVKHILAHHAEKHPTKMYSFTSDKDGGGDYENSRNRLYRRMTHLAGGTNHAEYDLVHHTIPAHKLKGS